MFSDHTICRQILARWEEYEQDRENKLEPFLDSLKEDQYVIEKKHEIKFENPAVTEPAKKGKHYFGKAQLKWTLRAHERAIECSDEAALAVIESILFVYKTAAGYLIREARFSIEACREDVSELRSYHEAARSFFAKALNEQTSFQDESKSEFVRRVDKIISCYCTAMEMAKLAEGKE